MKKYIVLATTLFIAFPLLALAAFVTYPTKTGDTLQSVAAAYGTTTAAIVAMNPNIKLASGQVLNVAVAPVVVPPVITPPTAGSTTVKIYNTLYGWPDNTPKNSSILSTGGQAGGDGTFNNPITAATGYVSKNGVITYDYPFGLKLYVINEHKYFVIADECGDVTDGSVACHTDLDHPGVPQIDLWAGGVGAKYNTPAGKAAMDCEDQHTRINAVIFNPAANLPVVAGNVYTTSCGQQFGDVLQ